MPLSLPDYVHPASGGLVYDGRCQNVLSDLTICVHVGALCIVLMVNSFLGLEGADASGLFVVVRVRPAVEPPKPSGILWIDWISGSRRRVAATEIQNELMN